MATSSEPFGSPDNNLFFHSAVGDLINLLQCNYIADGEFAVIGEPSVIPGEPQTLYVPGDYPTLGVAIAAARSGDQVEAAPGTYYERIHFDGKTLQLYSSAGSTATIIDGGQTGTVVYCNSSVGSETILEGFTITGGPSWIQWGGGMYNFYSSSTVTNCVFSNNLANNGGAGMCNQGGSPTVTSYMFSDNSAGAGGGACSTA